MRSFEADEDSCDLTVVSMITNKVKQWIKDITGAAGRYKFIVEKLILYSMNICSDKRY